MATRIYKPEVSFGEKLNEVDFHTLSYKKMPKGSIIQQRDFTAIEQEQITSGSGETATALSVTITPKLDTSKMWIMVTAAVHTDLVGINNDLQGAMSIYRNGTRITEPNSFSIRFIGDGQSYWEHGGMFAIQDFDKPMTNQPVTYTLYLNPKTSNADIYLNVNFGNLSDKSQSTMSVMEIRQ